MAPTEQEGRFVVFDPSTVSSFASINVSRMNLQPRVGIAWDLSGHGAVVLRAAYGVYTNQPPINMLRGTTTNPPLVTPLSYSGSIGLDHAIDLARTTGLAPSTVDPDFTPATSQSWNVNLQREVVHNIALMVGYFGARGSGLRLRPTSTSRSTRAALSRGCQSRARFFRVPLGNITQIGSLSRSDYRALWLSLRGRVSGALQLLGSYTLSKSTDYNSLTTQGVVAQDSYNVRGEVGPSDYDARHRATVTAVYELPFRGNPILEGWQIAAVVQAQSGSPVNIVTSTSTINGIPNTVRPDLSGRCGQLARSTSGSTPAPLSP